MRNKTVVITGSARAFGFEMAKFFRQYGYNVVLSDIMRENLERATSKLKNMTSEGKVISVVCDVTKVRDLENLLDETIKAFGCVDIWINNAGVNQPNEPIWNVEERVVDRLIDIDLKSAINASRIVMRKMIEQGFGQIYGVEGCGSNDAMQVGLSIYGTSKRAVTYFFSALAKEVKDEGLPVKVGLLAPGIMITNFISHALGNEKFDLPLKTKKVYNILGDYPDVIAKYLVSKMVVNQKNDVRFTWLTNRKAV